ncbi:MAG: ribonuclease Z, partial [Pseudomonadota bacterium]
MRPSFIPKLINDPFSDPGLYIPFLFEKRALMFDLGDLHGLSSKDLLKVTHVFVTHTHMDHFIGFDTLLRHFLGRDKVLHLFGPQGFLGQVEGKLAGYTWNLVDGYQYDFLLKVTEVLADRTLTKAYVCRDRFSAGEIEKESAFSGILLEEPAFSVKAVTLDHNTPCLGFSLVENFYVNIIKEGLKALGLKPGPWLTQFKKALYEKRDLESDFSVILEEDGRSAAERRFTLGG